MVVLKLRDEYIAGTYEIMGQNIHRCGRIPNPWFYKLQLPIWQKLRGAAIMWRMWDDNDWEVIE